jgi:methyl-accepting chemotaxis protein
LLIGKIGTWLEPGPAAVFAVVFITVYFVFAYISNRENHVRSDRLGDNCYYLGLIYTLASLIASLIVLGREPTDNSDVVDELLGNFGLALVSTAAGIVARLIMIQFRAESDDVDMKARVTIADTARQMEGDLMEAASTFRRLMQGAQETFSLSIAQTKRNVEEVEQIARSIRSVEISPEQFNHSLVMLVARLEEAADTLTKASEAVSLHARSADNTAKSVADTEVGLSGVRRTLAEVTKSFDAHREASDRAVKALQSHVDRTESYRNRLDEDAENARIAVQRVYSALGELTETIVERLRK